MKQIDWVVISINMQKKAGWGRANGAGPRDDLQMKVRCGQRDLKCGVAHLSASFTRGEDLKYSGGTFFNCEWKQSSF